MITRLASQRALIAEILINVRFQWVWATAQVLFSKSSDQVWGGSVEFMLR
jgi:hypothetical protein